MSLPILNPTRWTPATVDHVDHGRGQEHRWIGKCRACGQTARLEGRLAGARTGSTGWQVVQTPAGLYMTGDIGTSVSTVPIHCPSCQKWMMLRMVHEGTKKSKHECGARCTNATGPNCDCRCRGKNHGSNC